MKNTCKLDNKTTVQGDTITAQRNQTVKLTMKDQCALMLV